MITFFFKKGDRVVCIKGDVQAGPHKQKGIRGIVAGDFPAFPGDPYVFVSWESIGPSNLMKPDQVRLEFDTVKKS